MLFGLFQKKQIVCVVEVCVHLRATMLFDLLQEKQPTSEKKNSSLVLTSVII